MSGLARPCLDCGVLIRSGSRCKRHQKAHEEQRRPSSAERCGPGWAAVAKQVLWRDRYECQLRLPGCTRVATTADHVIARSQGGTNDLENLQAACARCNSAKGAKAAR